MTLAAPYSPRTRFVAVGHESPARDPLGDAVGSMVAVTSFFRVFEMAAEAASGLSARTTFRQFERAAAPIHEQIQENS